MPLRLVGPVSCAPTGLSGNQRVGVDDSLHVDCSTYREALSARMDGEVAPVRAESLDAHLETCDACRQWQDRAAAVGRRLRLRPVQPTPDLAESVLRAAPATTARPRRWPRILLAWVAVCQVALALGEVVRGGLVYAGQDAADMAAHLFNESTSWNLALGIGLLWAARRVHAITGMLPVMTVFVAVLGLFCCHDLITGQVPVHRVASHSLVVLGLVLLLVVRRDRDRQPSPELTRADGGASVADSEPVTPHVHAPQRPARRRYRLLGLDRAA